MTNHASLILALILSFFCFEASAAEYRGTMEQRAACTPDAFRFCEDAIPDPKKVELCLRSKKPQLSADCRVAFEPPAK